MVYSMNITKVDVSLSLTHWLTDLHNYVTVSDIVGEISYDAFIDHIMERTAS